MPNPLRYLISGFESSYKQSAQEQSEADRQQQREQWEEQKGKESEERQERRSQETLNREETYQDYKEKQKTEADELETQNRKNRLAPLFSGQVPQEGLYLAGLPKGDVEEYSKIKTAIKPEKPVKPETINLSTPTIDRKLNRIVQERGHLIDDSEIGDYPESQIRKIGDKNYVVTDSRSMGKAFKEIDQNGKREKEFTKDMQIVNKKYFDVQQNYQRALQTGYKSNGQPVTEDERANFKQVLNEWNKKYVEHVKATMPKAALKWYNDLYNQKDENGKTGNPSPDEYLKNLHKHFIDGEFKGANEKVIMRSLSELHRAIYSQDPTGQGYSDPDETDATDNNEHEE